MVAEALVYLMGPTAVGKTAIAVELAQLTPSTVISVDSAMVYRGMDIGTAKPGLEVLRRVPHRLIDIRDPADSYSAGAFYRDAHQEITAIRKREHFPLLVGGTSLYFHVLQHGIAVLPKANSVLREQLTNRLKKEGLGTLYSQLQSLDPDAAQRIHLNDTQRILRALEVCLDTGRALTQLHREVIAPPLIPQGLKIAILPPDKEWLNRRIEQRFKEMIQLGFVDEVFQLFQRPDLNGDLVSMRTVGYRQVWNYFRGTLSYSDMQERAIIATRQLAKRQLTWLRQYNDLHYFTAGDKQITQKILGLLESSHS